ncbi:MAG: hypothetical protein RIR95_1653, partial [Pseudomonadota bacterium]
AFAVDQRLGTAERNHADGRLAGTNGFAEGGLRGEIGAEAKVWHGRILRHVQVYSG